MRVFSTGLWDLCVFLEMVSQHRSYVTYVVSLKCLGNCVAC